MGHKHVPIDRLTALAFVARAPEGEHDQQALSHVSQCDRCAAELARLTMAADHLRDAAFTRVDAIFDDVMLDAQRSRILDRLGNLGQVARVLRFPRRSRDVTMPATGGGRRWISVAAAAGLIIGLIGGQLLHFLPSDAGPRREGAVSLQAPVRQPGPTLLPVAAVAAPSVSDEQLLDDIEAAVQLRRAHSLRALDALTPSAGDFRELRVGR